MALALNPSVSDVCFDTIGHARVYVRPHELYTLTDTRSVDHMLKRKVAASVVQTCSKDGYVLSGTASQRGASRANRALCKPLEIVSRSLGTVPHEHLNGALVYQVCYKHLVCNPPLDVVVPAVVCDSNKLGMRCHYYPYAFDEASRTVDAGDVGKGGANFLAVFLPKALHFNLAVESDHTEDAASGEGASTLQALYEREEARANDPNADEDKRLVVYVRIRQKRFDLNDKAIATVGVLHPGPDANEATGNDPTP